MKINLIFIFSLLSIVNLYSQDIPRLSINEFLANSGFSNDTPDWVEIYNDSNDTINMAGMYWTDDLEEPYKFAIALSYGDSTKIAPNTYCQFFFSKKMSPNANVVPLELDKNGEQIGLFSATGVLIDSLSFGNQPLNVSCGKSDQKEWVYFIKPSPNALNGSSHFKARLKKPNFSHQGGYYGKPFAITVEPSEIDCTICYTLDGSTPQYDNCRYFGDPLIIDSTCVFNAMAFRDGHLASKLVSETFLFRAAHRLPVVSIIADDWSDFYNLMDPTLAKEGRVTYMDENGIKQFYETIELAIAGGASRRHDQKPISLHTQSQLGGKWLKYPLFPNKEMEKYRGFVLRNGGNSVPHTQFRDAFLQHLVGQLGNVDYLDSRPVVTYINGNYYGIYNIREKKCRHYFESNHNLHPDSINVLLEYEHTLLGNTDSWNELLTFVESNNLSDFDNLNAVLNKIDVENFIDYQIAEIFYANSDWPMHNVRLWEPQKVDGKWRWILFDLDMSFREYKLGWNSLKYGLGENNFHSDRDTKKINERTLLLRKLTGESPFFRHRFINRFSDLMNTVFSSEYMLASIDSFQQLYSPEIKEHIDKWYVDDESEITSHKSWLSGIKNLKYFAIDRPDSMRLFIDEQWSLGGWAKVAIENNNVEGGSVQLNTLQLTKDKWVGDYFLNVPIELTALPREGYKFSHWESSRPVDMDLKKQVSKLLLKKEEPVTIYPIFKKRLL